MFATANSCFSNQEFSKIGNKVFIPPGVKTYFQRLNRFANIFRKWLTQKQNKQNTFKLKIKSCLSWIWRRRHLFSTANGEHPSTPRHRPIYNRRDETFDAISIQGMVAFRQPSDSSCSNFNRLGSSLMLLCDGTRLNQDFSCNAASDSQKSWMIASATLVAPEPLMSPDLAASLSR